MNENQQNIVLAQITNIITILENKEYFNDRGNFLDDSYDKNERLEKLNMYFDRDLISCFNRKSYQGSEEEIEGDTLYSFGNDEDKFEITKSEFHEFLVTIDDNIKRDLIKLLEKRFWGNNLQYLKDSIDNSNNNLNTNTNFNKNTLRP